MAIIKKILLVPSGRIVLYEDELLYAPFFERMREKISARLQKRQVHYDGELQFYGDIPAILGKGNTFVFGRYRPNVLRRSVPEDCPYLSCIGNPEPTFFKQKSQLSHFVRCVDAVLVSTRSGMRGRMAILEARKYGIPIAVLDYKDHPELYGMEEEETRKELFRGFRFGEHFDIFFKKELPLGYASDTVRPLVPVCVRSSSYLFHTIQKDQSIFFSGRPQPACQGDRVESVELIKKHFPGACVTLHDSQRAFLTAQEYCDNFARSKMVLSPSGVSWDTVRHAETGLAPDVLLIAPRPYIEAVKPHLEDGVNALLYCTNLGSDGKYHLIEGEELVDKIRYYLAHDDERARIARRWRDDVLRGHTIEARSRYILQSIEHVLSV